MNIQKSIDWFFEPVSYLIPTGRSVENRTTDNPDGIVYSFEHFVRAIDDCGNTFLWLIGMFDPHDHLFAQAITQAQVDALRTRWLKLGKLPVNFSSWVPGEPIYGSHAYNTERVWIAHLDTCFQLNS